MPDCPKCNQPMKFSRIESSAMRNIYRCYNCKTRKSKRSGLRWAITGGKLLLALGAGVPLIDPTDFVDLVDPTDMMGL
jgi:hypothetical protein